LLVLILRQTLPQYTCVCVCGCVCVCVLVCVCKELNSHTPCSCCLYSHSPSHTAHTCVCVCVCGCARVFMCVCADIRVGVHVCMSVCLPCARVCRGVSVYSLSNTNTHIHTLSHTHSHTYAQVMRHDIVRHHIVHTHTVHKNLDKQYIHTRKHAHLKTRIHIDVDRHISEYT